MAATGPDNIIARRVTDDLIAFSGETLVPKYMKFFLVQKDQDEVHDSLLAAKDAKRGEESKLLALHRVIAKALEEIESQGNNVEILDDTKVVKVSKYRKPWKITQHWMHYIFGAIEISIFSVWLIQSGIVENWVLEAKKIFSGEQAVTALRDEVLETMRSRQKEGMQQVQSTSNLLHSEWIKGEKTPSNVLDHEMLEIATTRCKVDSRLVNSMSSAFSFIDLKHLVQAQRKERPFGDNGLIRLMVLGTVENESKYCGMNQSIAEQKQQGSITYKATLVAFKPKETGKRNT
ncbi:hypothetical protein Tco_1124192 [Tanacetum coccineum]|uniref:Uncharacterized protein n=1 Tax=Tanacetum coccineum TaxID=301880 RepID=A0ABQ5J5F1_9ASTR